MPLLHQYWGLGQLNFVQVFAIKGPVLSRRCLTIVFPDLYLFQCPLPLVMFLEPPGRTNGIDVPFIDRHSTDTCSLHFDQL